MKKWLFLIPLLLVGCAPAFEPITPITSEPEVVLMDNNKPTIGISNVKIWIGSSEGLFTGGAYYPGATAEATLPIYNMSDQDIKVRLIVEPPPKQTRAILSDGTEDFDYEVAPLEVENWVTLEETNPLIPAKSMRDIKITLEVPKSVENLPHKWEFRVTVIPSGQGAYETAVQQRWLVTMR